MRDDLRQGARRLRDALRDTPRTRGAPSSGKLLATLPRGPEGEVRLTWVDHPRRPYLSLWGWNRDGRGNLWPDRTVGVRIYPDELPALADALLDALAQATAYVRER